MSENIQPTTGASSPADFKKKAAGQLLHLPSGLSVVCRKLDLRTFMLKNKGAVPNGLMKIVQESLDKGDTKKVEQMMDASHTGDLDLDQVSEMYQVVEDMIVAAVTEPVVHPAPGPREERRDDQVYVDEFEDDDKLFIFGWLNGGTDDVETFRKETRASLVAVAEGEVDQQPTQ